MHALFRFDINEIIGGGHKVRCTHLASALWKAGWKISIAVSENDSDIGHLRTAEAFPFPANVTALPHMEAGIPAVGTGPIDLLVVDSYDLIGPYRSYVEAPVRVMLRMVDWPQPVPDADLVLDISSGADPADYQDQIGDRADLLLGPSFAIIAPPFREARDASVERQMSDQDSIQNIFVSFGLGDTTALCGAALRALNHAFDDLSPTIDLALSAASAETLKRGGEGALVKRLIENGTAVLHPDTRKVADLMAVADIAVGGCGMTSWERCCLGLPSIAWPLSENQLHNAQLLSEKGAILQPAGLGFANTAADAEHAIRSAFEELSADPEQRRAMAKAGAELIDGGGLDRIVKAVDTCLGQ